MRVVPLKHIQTLIVGGEHLALCRYYLTLIDIDLPFNHHEPERPKGQCRLVPDFGSIRLHQRHEEHAVVFCYFAAPESQLASNSPFSFVAPLCPRRALTQALDAAPENGLSFRVGFELEFSCREVNEDLDTKQVHQSSSLQAIDSFMLPVFCKIINILGTMDISVEQFHCEGDPDAYELVTEHMSASRAVDAFMSTKVMARSICRDNSIHLTFNPASPGL